MAQRSKATPTSGSLVVRNRAEGPVLFAKWRDSERRQVMRRLGRAWLVEVGHPDAHPRGQRVGDWVERRGRVRDGFLDTRTAYGEMQDLIAAHDEEHDSRRPLGTPAEVSVAQAADAWLERGRTEREWKHSTACDYTDVARRVVRELGHLRVSEVQEQQLKRFLLQLRPERNGAPLATPPSARMRAKYTVVLRAIFKQAEEDGWIEHSPAERLRVNKRKQHSKNHPLRRDEYLTPDEVHSIVGAASRRRRTDAALVLTLAFAGLRLGEGLALRWQDVDVERAALRVESNWTKGRTGTPKGGAGRTIPMADEIALAVQGLRHRGHTVGPTDLVFVGIRGGHLDVHGFRRRFYEAQHEAQVSPRRTIHQLRHTFATVCASHGIPLRTIQGWCGHEDYATTERYAHFLPRHEDAALVSAAFRASPQSASTVAERAA